ncbi:hypothetical protein KHQ06_27095 [Nocardia tengchongensis]|uniref:Uncharacterized protein n=1 Tax=Nocardia tengchongensis TaxID=2055889 RepID=A0ABX8CN47_9NOCA|nr:hypothetical protein KHQ06_27095 [Nocardia tengchongensis]
MTARHGGDKAWRTAGLRLVVAALAVLAAVPCAAPGHTEPADPWTVDGSHLERIEPLHDRVSDLYVLRRHAHRHPQPHRARG